MSLPDGNSSPPSASSRPLETFFHSTASTHLTKGLSLPTSPKSKLRNAHHSNHQQTPPNILNPFENYFQPLSQDAINNELANSIPIPDRNHSLQVAHTMDPFECRVRFTNLIINLNATTTSAVKAAQYALKYRDMDEDLHSCIIEQLERQQTTPNTRANILYFLEVLCDLSAPSAQNHPDYIRMMQRDILRIVDAVAPPDLSGAANIKIVRKVLAQLATKNYLLHQTVEEIEELLKERDTGLDTEMEDMDELSPALGHSHSNVSLHQNGAMKLDKKQTEQRIEEDRERHKRLRESIWAIPVANNVKGTVDGLGTIDAEFDQLWEETSELGEDDLELYREEDAERKKAGARWGVECAGREKE